MFVFVFLLVAGNMREFWEIKNNVVVRAMTLRCGACLVNQSRTPVVLKLLHFKVAPLTLTVYKWNQMDPR